ncbi:MAG: rod shape-determining protein [Clostridiales bacterium]|nr:rod shape-determining protein [Clostridiales bacterium]
MACSHRILPGGWEQNGVKQLGLDLGSSNTRIVTKEKGIELLSPTAAAFEKKSGRMVAIGAGARRMLGKTPVGIEAIRPVQGGVIAEPEAATRMLRRYFKRLEAVSLFRRPDVIASVPCNINEVERRALEDTIYDAGARQVFIIEAPLAAALGAGLPVAGAKGSMIVNIGGGCTQAAVLSMGGIVISDSLRVGGIDFDRAIVQYLRKKYELLCGELTAETLKIRIGSAWPKFDRGTYDVAGRDLGGGLTKTIKVSSADICEALYGRLEQITAMVKTTLEETPPELASDIYDSGIVLTGGGALLEGLPELITRLTGIRTIRAKKAPDCVCRGIHWCLGNPAASRYIRYRA